MDGLPVLQGVVAPAPPMEVGSQSTAASPDMAFQKSMGNPGATSRIGDETLVNPPWCFQFKEHGDEHKKKTKLWDPKIGSQGDCLGNLCRYRKVDFSHTHTHQELQQVILQTGFRKRILEQYRIFILLPLCREFDKISFDKAGRILEGLAASPEWRGSACLNFLFSSHNMLHEEYFEAMKPILSWFFLYIGQVRRNCESGYHTGWCPSVIILVYQPNVSTIAHRNQPLFWGNWTRAGGPSCPLPAGCTSRVSVLLWDGRTCKTLMDPGVMKAASPAGFIPVILRSTTHV